MRIYTGQAKYWDRENKIEWGGPPTSWDFSMPVVGLPFWGVRVKPGDVLRSNAMQETKYQSTYENMGIAVAFISPDTPEGQPTAPNLNPFKAAGTAATAVAPAACSQSEQEAIRRAKRFRAAKRRVWGGGPREARLAEVKGEDRRDAKRRVTGAASRRQSGRTKAKRRLARAKAKRRRSSATRARDARPLDGERKLRRAVGRLGGEQLRRRRPRVNIADFRYLPGDLSTRNSVGIPTVPLGSKLRFNNLEGGSIFHTITSCKFPCLGQTGAAFPLADGATSQSRQVDFDSSELGIGRRRSGRPSRSSTTSCGHAGSGLQAR